MQRKKCLYKNYLKLLQSVKMFTRESIKTKSSETVQQKKQSDHLGPL